MMLERNKKKKKDYLSKSSETLSLNLAKRDNIQKKKKKNQTMAPTLNKTTSLTD